MTGSFHSEISSARLDPFLEIIIRAIRTGRILGYAEVKGHFDDESQIVIRLDDRYALQLFDMVRADEQVAATLELAEPTKGGAS